MTLPNDADEATIVYAVNRMADGFDTLTRRLDEAVADRQLEIKGIRDRLTAAEAKLLERGQVVRRSELEGYVRVGSAVTQSDLDKYARADTVLSKGGLLKWVGAIVASLFSGGMITVLVLAFARTGA